MKIIALTGPKGSGKDTVATIIQALYGYHYDVETIAFADPIKKVVQHVFQLDTNDTRQYDDFKRTNVHYWTPNKITRDMVMHEVPGRHVVREIGMLMREYNVNQFTDYVNNRFNECRLNDNKIFVVTDLRFDNEYMMLKSWNADIVKIIRPQYQHDGHITERGFDDHLVSKILMNDGSVEYLTTRVRTVMDSLLEEKK